MYLWKCWRESRMQFIVGVVALAALCSFFTVVAVRFGRPGATGTEAPLSVARAWSSAAVVVLGGWASFLIIVWGLILGSMGLGVEFERLTADFLFTRPRRRKYWVWVGWPAGMLELSTIVFSAVAATFTTLAFLTGHVYTWRLLAAVPALVIGGAVVYGLTYFLTVVARSGRQGLNYAIGILLVTLLVSYAAGYYWEVHVPSVWGFTIASCNWAVGITETFPFDGVFLWVAVALAFPLAAQVLVERTEI